MLQSLAIRDIVLIEALDLDLGFEGGLGVLTGETGAGKSILLDSLGLALGGRADRALVREGATRGSVAAVFRPSPDHPALALLAERGIEVEDDLVLRRTLNADGRSRAFVNDQPVSTGLLRRLGDTLVEVHGQHDAHGLMDPSTHRGLVDAFGRLEAAAAATRAAHGAWQEAARRLAALADDVERARREEMYWRQAEEELAALDPRPGEEAELAETRARLMNREKLAEAIQGGLEALNGKGGACERFAAAERRLGRVLDLAEDLLRPALEAVQRAFVEANEAATVLEGAGRDLESGAFDLERIEERLYGLRDAARKYRVDVDGLSGLRAEVGRRLAELDAGGERVAAAEAEAAATRARFVAAAGRLSVGRAAAGRDLAAAMMAELPPLKLDRARLRVAVDALDEAAWTAGGAERLSFEVSTNPGQTPGPLGKVASGGELSRLMLAMKVVLARVSGPGTLVVFDEVDAGVGGATADAVGERLAKLAGDRQVLVVTHAPQVAARANHHWRVMKRAHAKRTAVDVVRLTPAERREEIARMLAGAEITAEARAAADSLMRRSA